MSWTFTYVPATDEAVDPEWKLDQDDRFGIQDASAYGGGLVVTETSPADTPGFWLKHHETFSSLDAAMLAVIRLAEQAQASTRTEGTGQ